MREYHIWSEGEGINYTIPQESFAWPGTGCHGDDPASTVSPVNTSPLPPKVNYQCAWVVKSTGFLWQGE